MKRIDKQTLHKLYWEEKKSLKEIAEILGVSDCTVLRWMREYNIPRRTRGESKRIFYERERRKRGVSKDVLERLYWDEGKSAEEIGRIFGVRGSVVQEWMKKYGIPLRSRSESQKKRWEKRKVKEHPILKKNILYKLYWEQGKSVIEIGKELGVSEATVRKYMKRYGIPRRSRSEANTLRWKKQRKREGKVIDLSKELLEKLYVQQRKSTVEIGKQLGISPSTVRDLLRKYNIPIRDLSDAIRNIYDKQGKKKPTREELYLLYWIKNMSVSKIAKKFYVTSSTVHRWLNKYSIPKRTCIEERKKYYMNRKKEKEVENLIPKIVCWEEERAVKKIIEEMGYYSPTAWRLIKGRKKYVQNYPRVKVNFSDERTLSYILGVLLGDGYVILNERKNKYLFGLHQTRKEFAESFKSALIKLGLHPWVSKTSKNTYRVSARSKSFVEFYNKLTLKDVRKIVLKNKENMKEFIRGFYESEGTNSETGSEKRKYKNWEINMVNTNFEVIMLVKEVLDKLGFKFSLYIQEPSGKSKKVAYILSSQARDQNYEFLELIKPVIKNTLRRPRKLWKWTKEEVVKSIRNMYEETGEIPRKRDVPKNLNIFYLKI